MRGILLEGLQELSDITLRWDQHVGAIEEPAIISIGCHHSSLIGIAPQVYQQRDAQRYEGLTPRLEGCLGTLLHEEKFPIPIAQCGQVAVIRKIEDLFTGTLLGLPGQIGQEVVTIEMNLIVALDRILTGQELFLDLLITFPAPPQAELPPTRMGA